MTSAGPDAGIWPDDRLDVDDLISRGWHASPFREFVIKIHQRCNLACTYCYVYTMADQSWAGRPTLMPESIRATTAERIAAHADKHGLTSLLVILHGGEPMLAGAETLARVAADIRAALPAGCRLRVGMQTNGTLLAESEIRTLAAAGIKIGVSVDGDATAHDSRRKYLDGRGSYARTAEALALLSGRYRESFSGLLATIDISQDPVAFYEALTAHEPPAIDLLLPHANWASPPAEGGYGAWLSRVFDRWYDAPRRETRVRLFDELLRLVLGGSGRTDQVGLTPSLAVVIETDGAIEQTDALKSTYEGAAATPWNVVSDSFDEALCHPGFVARQIGASALSEICTSCPVLEICGGGHYAHRYREPDGFRNPSVYCSDLRILIDHVSRRVSRDLLPNGIS